MVNINAFFSRLIPHVLGCPEPLASQAVLDAAIEFCSTTQSVTEMLDPITLPAGIGSYELETPTGTVVDQVLNVWYDENLLQAIPYGQSTNIYRPDATPQEYHGEYIDEVLNLTVFPAPDRLVRNGLVVRVSLRPSRTATQLHDILYQRYADAIVYAAAARLMAIPDQPFTNEQKAVMFERAARAKANIARADALQGRVTSSLSVQMRAF